MKTLLFITLLVAALSTGSTFDGTITVDAVASSSTCENNCKVTCTYSLSIMLDTASTSANDYFSILIWAAKDDTFADTTTVSYWKFADSGTDPDTDALTDFTVTDGSYTGCAYMASGTSTSSGTGSSFFTLTMDTTTSVLGTNLDYTFDLTSTSFDSYSLAEYDAGNITFYYEFLDFGTTLAITEWESLTLGTSAGDYDTLTLDWGETKLGNRTIGTTSTDFSTTEILEGCDSGTVSSGKKQSILAAAFALSFF